MNSRQVKSVISLLFAAYTRDVSVLRRFALSSMDMEQKDYDSRTALHVAAAEGGITPQWKRPSSHHNVVTIIQDYQNKYNQQETPMKDKKRAYTSLGGLL